MSKIVTTKLGRFRAVTDGINNWWLWECSRCQREWLPLTGEQMDGKASVVHVAYWNDHGELSSTAPSDWSGGYCGYHEIHEFGKELVATIQTRAFFGEALYEEDAIAA